MQEALRGVVRKVLAEVAKTGLPGQHHFYISFDTQHPGVRLSTRMRQRYPVDMTIVLQHSFWDLAVTDHAVEVGLSFNNVPERLLIPFSAMKAFADPSVPFEVHFEVVREAPVAETPAVEPPRIAAAPAALPKPAETPRSAAKATAAEGEAAAEPAKDTAEPADGAAPGGATVVSIDAFRKKV